MEATDQIDKLIQSCAKGRKEANAEAARQREIDLKRLAAMREENRAAWIYHLRRVAGSHLKAARSARARARRLENGEA